MAHAVDVELAEGGRARVYPGDPAWAYCQRLKKEGYSHLVLPTVVLMTGLPRSVYLMEKGAIDTTAPITDSLTDEDIVRVLAADMQLASRESEAVDQLDPAPEENLPACVHHWMLETVMVKGDHVRGVCKNCGEEKLHKQRMVWANVESWAMHKDRRRKAYLEEWNERIVSTAEILRGPFTKAA